MPKKFDEALSIYTNDRSILEAQEKKTEILADMAGETYTPDPIPKSIYTVAKRMRESMQKENEYLQQIAENGGTASAGVNGLAIDYATDVLSLEHDGQPISNGSVTLPAYGLNYDTTTGGLTLTKNGAAMQDQTVALPDYGSPLVASSTSDMTDTDKVYVNTTDGKWYYYDGDSWEIGGTYNSQGIDTDTTLAVSGAAADAKATGDKLAEVKNDVTYSSGNTRLSVTTGGYIDLSSSTADISSPVSSTIAQYAVVSCEKGDMFTIMHATTQALSGSSVRAYGFLASDGTVLDVVDAWQNIATEQIVCAPADSAYFVANSLNDDLVVYSGKLLHENVENNSDNVAYVTNSYNREFTVSDYSTKYDNSGKLSTSSSMTSAFIEVEAGYSYKLKAIGTFNRLIVSGCNGKTTGNKCTRIYTKSSGVQTKEEYTYTCDGTYKYIIVLLNYNTGSSAYSATFSYTKSKTADEFNVNGIRVYTSKEIDDRLDYVANAYMRDVTVDSYVHSYDNNGVLASYSVITSAFIDIKSGYKYNIDVAGTYFNRFIVVGTNYKTNGSECTRLYSAGTGSKTHETYEYTSDGTYKYLLVVVNYKESDATAYNATMTYTETNGDPDNFKVNGIPVYSAEQTDEKILNVTSEYASEVTVTNYVHKLDNDDEIGTLSAITSAWIDLTSGNKYTIDVTGTYFNRFNITGTNSQDNGSSSTRLYSGGTSSRTHETYEYVADGTYKYLLVTLNYEAGESSVYNATLKYNIIHGYSNDFTVNKIKVYTAEQSDKLMVNRHRLGVTTVQLGGDTPADDVKNLSLFATKVIYSEGCVPETTGYLYVDDATQKFYYSAPTPYTPKYIFDWNTTASGGSRYEYFSATITADGDIIFLRNFTRWTPIIYSPNGQGVYSAQIIQFSQDDKRPYAWLMGSSVAQFADGSFVFGDYAYHSETDEANNDGRIIWRVTKPYTTVANWQKVHTFKHVYSTHHQSDEPDNEIGHIHAIMYDFYADDLYCTTGDIDRHCRLWISEDHGVTWSAIPGAVGTTEDTTVQAEGQKWRMTNCVFTEDAMWWATDAQYPYHLLWKCTRDASGHVDTSTLTEAADLEVPVLPNGQSQRTYITALMRDRNGLLFVDRGEPRGDKLDIKFYSFETGEVYTTGTFVRAETDASDLDSGGTRIGLPQQVTSVYQPQCMRGIITGGGKIDRPNITSLFNNAQNHYVGTLILEL